MTESRVFADSYSRKFSDLREFLSFLTEREQNSRWVMSSSKNSNLSRLRRTHPWETCTCRSMTVMERQRY